jgi:hypothetical protein
VAARTAWVDVVEVVAGAVVGAPLLVDVVVVATVVGATSVVDGASAVVGAGVVVGRADGPAHAVRAAVAAATKATAVVRKSSLRSMGVR